MDFDRRRATLAIAVARVITRHPGTVPIALAWSARLVRRAGLRRLLRGHPRAVTFVVHACMDADVVRPAWQALQRSETATDPEVRAAQERLQACSYAMAHPDQDRLVPACVQHSVIDPEENARLARLLPLRTPRS